MSWGLLVCIVIYVLVDFLAFLSRVEKVSKEVEAKVERKDHNTMTDDYNVWIEYGDVSQCFNNKLLYEKTKVGKTIKVILQKDVYVNLGSTKSTLLLKDDLYGQDL